MPVKMSRVYTLIGCLAVMGAVQAKEGNREPPQEPPQDQPPDGQGIFQIPPQEFQGYEAQTQQLQPQQQQQQQRNHPQRWLRRVKTMGDDLDEVLHMDYICGILPCDVQPRRFSIILPKNKGLQVDQFMFQPRHTERASTAQLKWIQKWIQEMKKNESLQPGQLNSQNVLIQLAGVSVILIALTSVLIEKLLSPGQQSNQRTIQMLQTDGKETVPQLNDQSQKERQSKYQQVQRTRLPRSISAVPWGQSVDILKTQGIQTRTAQLLSGIITLLQAAATESATTACKHRLLDTCAGGLRAAALC